MIDFGLVLARLLHYVATTVLFGASLFPFYAYADAEPERAGLWRGKLLLLAVILALLSGLLWFVLSAANMTGSLSELADGDALWAVVHDTGFGVIWIGRMILATVMIVGLAAVRPLPTTSLGQNVAISILAAILLVSLAGTGHAQVEEGWASLVHISSDGAHLLAAGAWLGGLVPLGYVLAHYSDTRGGNALVERVLLKFSGMGYTAVAALIGTGLVNSWFLVGSVSNLPTTPYGEMLLTKLALFAGMLALAAANRFWLVPSIGEADEPIRKLRKHVLGEQLLGAAILVVVSALGTMPPPVSQ
jgi:putative copper resistance protein D